MSAELEDKEIEFILKLAALTREYGIAIGGCGCCESPWLDAKADVSDPRAGYKYDNEAYGLQWCAPSGDKWAWDSVDVVRKAPDKKETPA